MNSAMFNSNARVRRIRSQLGFTLIETLVATAIFGAIGVVFVYVISSTQMGAHRVEAKSEAESIARSQVELIKSLPYSDTDSYPLVTNDNDRYVAEIEIIDLSPVEYPSTLQKIVITVSENGDEILTLETLKAKR